MRRDWSEVFEEAAQLTERPKVASSTFGKEQQVVEEVECRGRWLINRSYDNYVVLLCYRLNKLHDFQACH